MEERRQRSRLLAARDEFMQKLGHEAKARLLGASTTNQSAYVNLLKDLIRQGLERLSGEKAVHVLCRPQDLAIVQRVAPTAAQVGVRRGSGGENERGAPARPTRRSLLTLTCCLDGALLQEASAAAAARGEERSVTITTAADPALGTSAGGVILTAFGGKIRCCNTLEERLAMSLVDLTPVVRDLLFPSARAGESVPLQHPP
jgi:vacuolar-type H+-ATPase subunit E/Vma4